MLYAKMAGIAVFAFGFSAFLILYFSSGGSSDSAIEPTPAGEVVLEQKDLAQELSRLVDRNAKFLLFARPNPIMNSAAGDILELTLEDFDRSREVSQVENTPKSTLHWLSKVEWLLLIGPNRFLESHGFDFALNPNVANEQRKHYVGMIRFHESIDDEAMEKLFRRFQWDDFSRSMFRERTMWVNDSPDSLSVWRLDAKSFLVADAERIRKAERPLLIESNLEPWISNFKKGPIYDDFVAISDMKRIRQQLAQSNQDELCHVLRNTTTMTLELNFTKRWFVICRFDTLGRESAWDLRKAMGTMWHAVIGQMITDIRFAESDEDTYAKRETLKAIKSLTISSRRSQVIIGMPKPKEFEIWVERFIEEHQMLNR